MTVGELRKLLENAPDDMQIRVYPEPAEEITAFTPVKARVMRFTTFYGSTGGSSSSRLLPESYPCYVFVIS